MHGVCFWWAFSGEASPAGVGKIADWNQLLQQEALQLQGNAQRSGNYPERRRKLPGCRQERTGSDAEKATQDIQKGLEQKGGVI